MCLNPNNMMNTITKYCRKTRTDDLIRPGIENRLDEWPANIEVIYI